MNYVIAIGMFQALVATVLLWPSRLKNKADGLLLLLLACIGMHLGIKFVIYNFINDNHVRLQMNTFIGFCYGPLIYLYALKKKNDSFIPIYKWYLFLPFILGAIGYLTVISALSVSPDAGHWALSVYNNSTTYIFSFFNAACSVLTLYVSRKLPAEMKKEKQLIKEISLLLLFLAFIGVGYAVLKMFVTIHADLFFRSICYALLGIISIIIIRFKYVGIMATPTVVVPQQDILPDYSIAELHKVFKDEPIVDEPENLLIKRLQLSTAEHKDILHKSEAYLSKTNAYTDADLNLDKLAAAIGVSKYHLSETLNNHAQRSFYQYINEHRINRTLKQMQMMTSKGLPVNILTLAYDSGFKAKSSFNLYFKKVTGNTPTGYLRTLTDSLEKA